MESRVLNAYHSAQYLIHKQGLRTITKSFPRESSTPDHNDFADFEINKSNSSPHESDSNSENEVECQQFTPQNQYGDEVVMADSDEDCEVIVDDEPYEHTYEQSSESPIIQVFTVDPDLDLDGTDDDWVIEKQYEHNQQCEENYENINGQDHDSDDGEVTDDNHDESMSSYDDESEDEDITVNNVKDNKVDSDNIENHPVVSDGNVIINVHNHDSDNGEVVTEDNDESMSSYDDESDDEDITVNNVKDNKVGSDIIEDSPVVSDENIIINDHNHDSDNVQVMTDDNHDESMSSYDDESDHEVITVNNVDQKNVGLDIIEDGPVVSDVNEYFVNNNKNVEKNKLKECFQEMNITDGHGNNVIHKEISKDVEYKNKSVAENKNIVASVDEYFVQDTKNDLKSCKENTSSVFSVDDYFAKDVIHDFKTDEQKSSTVASVDKYFAQDNTSTVESIDEYFVKDDKNDFNVKESSSMVASVDEYFAKETTEVSSKPTTEYEKTSLPHIEMIKKFLLGDMPLPKYNSKTQRSCSLPQSPVHIPFMDDNARTSLSFEDLDLDFNTSGKTDSGDDVPRTLTEEDVNSFLITTEQTKDAGSDNMEIDNIVESKIVEEPKPVNVLDFCVEKTVKIEKEDKVDDCFVDVESVNDVIPVLEAHNVSSLLEQFEAVEKINVKEKPVGLANGLRLQDAAAQINKNKIRQILMSPPATVSKSIHSDHDYCSPKKNINPKLKGGQSLLKPEVLVNNQILISRRKSNEKVIDKPQIVVIKPSVKAPLSSNHRKKLSNSIDSKNNTVIKTNVNASKASDKNSQSKSGSIKLTIKNKSKVILNCDEKKDSRIKINSLSSKDDINRSDIGPVSNTDNAKLDMIDSRPGDFYTALFKDNNHILIPELTVKDELNKQNESKVVPQKKKLNLQEYMLRKGNSNNNSRTVSPEAIFPETVPKVVKKVDAPIPVVAETKTVAANKEVFDPIREASRKILMSNKRYKADQIRKRDEDLVMRKIPKVENLQLQPLMTDEEMMKMTANSIPEMAKIVNEKPKPNLDYEEKILVSIGTNTDDSIFKDLLEPIETTKTPSKLINFKIKSTNIIDKNVFDIEAPTPKEKQVKKITASMKIVERNVNKISSNSLLACIKDEVKKQVSKLEKSPEKHLSTPMFTRKNVKTLIVRDFIENTEHGEDKIILHLEKNRQKPKTADIKMQTDKTNSTKQLSELDYESIISGTKIPNKENRSVSHEKSTPQNRKSTRSRSRTRKRSRSVRRHRRKSSSYSRKDSYRSVSRTPVKRSKYSLKRRLRTPSRSKTLSECSESSSCSSSSSTSRSSSCSSRSRRSVSRRSITPVKSNYNRVYCNETRDTPVEERRIVFVGKLGKEVSKSSLKSQFLKFGPIIEVTLHTKDDGCRYGFVTYERPRDAWTAVESGKSFPQYDIGFGGRRAFCRRQYADLDGLEAEYSEVGYIYQAPAPPKQDLSFEQMLQDVKKKIKQRKTDSKL